MAAGLSPSGRKYRCLSDSHQCQYADDKEEMQTVIHIDVPMPFSYISEELIGQLERLEPFGNGNPKPVFAQKNVRILRKMPIGKQKQFLRLTLQGRMAVAWKVFILGSGRY